jgi:hypothetical protein
LALTAAPAGAEKICMDAIPAEMLDKVASATARAGGVFHFKIRQTVTLQDGTLVPAGTLGYGLIRSASAAGRHMHDGSIDLEPRYLVVAKTQGGYKHLHVAMDPTLPPVWTPSEPLLNKAASHVPLPIPGLVMTGVNYVRWGRNITLGPGFAFAVIPAEDLRGPIC